MGSVTSGTLGGEHRGVIMDSEDVRIEADVRVMFVEDDGPDVVVDIYGGEGLLCGTVRFHFKSKERSGFVSTLRRWRDAATPLTFVSRDGTVRLLGPGWLSERLELAHE